MTFESEIKNKIISQDDYCLGVKNGTVFAKVCQRAITFDPENNKNELVVNKCINFKDHDSFPNALKRWLGSAEKLDILTIPTKSFLPEDIKFSFVNNTGATH